MPKLAAALAGSCTVYTYDRRGRGESTDTQPYSVAREVEDLAALIDHAGGSAFVAGLSSGAALALEAAASGLSIRKLALYEPPFIANADVGSAHGNHEAELKRILASGRRGDAVKYFMRDMVNVPAPVVWIMRLMRPMWSRLESVAHTLPYDAAILSDFSVPKHRAAAINVPTLVMAGGKTDTRLCRAAEGIASAIPSAEHRILPGQTHNVSAKVLAPELVRFFLGDVAPDARQAA